VSFPDDHTQNATPPFGSDAGDILNPSDMISGSPTTSERVVDTQSGYLVLVKKVDGTRVALSVKRRIGTPPGSSIVLTSDEQVKLSKILADARHLTPTARVSPRAEQWTNTLSNKTRSGGEEFSYTDAPEREFAQVKADRQIEIALNKRRRRTDVPYNRAQAAGLIAGFLVLPALAFVGINKLMHSGKSSAQVAPMAVSNTAATEATRIDRFVRGYVADMLDFDPSTYRVSQIRAMSQMKPELLNRYWNETHFPLSTTQLQATPKGQTLMITKVTQQRGPDNTDDVDLFAELVSANSKISTPVHLRLTVGSTNENQIRVLEQKDLSGK
jgi:hypothetical protein